jgi:hypothetical protein
VKAIIFLFAFLSASGGVALAQGWPGYLVDGKCFESLERNKSPFDTETFVNRDVGREIRYCHPTAKTTSFMFIQQNGNRFRLDSAGNVKAAELVRLSGKKAADLVSVTGTKSGRTIQVTSISIAP